MTIDGYRYTLYRVTDNTNDCHKSADVKRLNGGGISWRDAMFECRKRGQHLAMIFTNEAATAIADMMLKNRPCRLILKKNKCLSNIICNSRLFCEQQWRTCGWAVGARKAKTGLGCHLARPCQRRNPVALNTHLGWRVTLSPYRRATTTIKEEVDA